MQSPDFKNVSYDEELKRTKWFKDDLDKGGWDEVRRSPGATFWMKTFPDQEVPIKSLFWFDMPLSANTVKEVMHISNLEIRKKWDRAFQDLEILESYPDGSILTSSKVEVSWPLSDRSLVLYVLPPKEVDWFGKKAFLMLVKQAWHPSRPAGADGMVRATNGGNFYLFVPDEKDPAGASKMFGLSNNNYNGCFPKTGRFASFVLSKKVPDTFYALRESIIEGYNKYFKNKE